MARPRKPPAKSPEVDEDDGELSSEQIAELKQDLLAARNDVISRMKQHVDEALGEPTRLPDEVDQANSALSQQFLLRLGDKERKLLNLIERALRKIDTGDFGECEGTGDPIPFKRLKLRPWARYSVEHKQWLEKERALHVDD